MGMCITGCFMERWEISFAVHGKVVFTFPCTVNGISHSGIASYAHFHDAVFPGLLWHGKKSAVWYDKENILQNKKIL